MHPITILVPAVALIFGPRLWVNHVLKQHNQDDEDFKDGAGVLARELLDRHHLQAVKVESTDLGDHYDPKAKAVRLSRDKFERKTLTAVTTAAHEVSHALQDASDYGPFLWRTRLVKIAQVTGEVGTVMLLSIPAAALMSRQPVPPLIIGAAAFAMLGTGVAAQLAALPSELDASFARALPMLRDGYISEEQLKDSRKILMACSLTYIASSLLAILNIWPWLGRGPMLHGHPRLRDAFPQTPAVLAEADLGSRRYFTAARRNPRLRTRKQSGFRRELFFQLGKPLVRGWFRVCGVA